MEKYIIRVNGTEYEVEVEKKEAGSETTAYQQPAVSKTVPQSAAAEAKGQEVKAGTSGKAWKIVATEGAAVKRGDSIVILEAMKMEIPVVAPCDGKVEKLFVSEGDPVEAGQKIATVI